MIDTQAIFQEAQRLTSNGEPFLLATVVHTKGSAPQKAGARMLVRTDGSFLGTLGGGCVEGDIWYLAREMLAEKSPPRFKTYTLNETMAAQDGLICGGTMYFFLRPVYPGSRFADQIPRILEALSGGKPLVSATLVDTPSGSPGESLLSDELSAENQPNGFALLAAALTEHRQLAAFGEKHFLRQPDGRGIYLEGFTTAPLLVILGAGHVGKAVCKLAVDVGLQVVIIDDRADFANRERFPEATTVIAADFAAGIRQLTLNANSYILVATRGHRYDDDALQAALNTPASYIGLLGSKRKSLLIYESLREKGISEDALQRVHAPVGLDIGAISPAELAVSIIAEIIAVRRAGKGGFMKMKLPTQAGIKI